MNGLKIKQAETSVAFQTDDPHNERADTGQHGIRRANISTNVWRYSSMWLLLHPRDSVCPEQNQRSVSKTQKQHLGRRWRVWRGCFFSLVVSGGMSQNWETRHNGLWSRFAFFPKSWNMQLLTRAARLRRGEPKVT